MKKRIYLLIFTVFSVITILLNSCQQDEKKVINIYSEPEIQNYVAKLVKRYKKVNDKVEIKLNNITELKEYDIILTNDREKKGMLKHSYREFPFLEDSIVIVGRRKLNGLDDLYNTEIAIPNYKTAVGKLAVDILSENPNFNEFNKKIEYKDDVISCIQSVDLYEVDCAVITKYSLPYLKNSEVCYDFSKESEKNKVVYKAYIKNKKDKELRKIYDIIEDEILKNK